MEIERVICHRMQAKYAPLENALETLKALNSGELRGRVYLFYCGTQDSWEPISKWLESIDFVRKTSISLSHITVSAEEIDQAETCARKGVTHFVAAKLKVLADLRDACIPNLYLFQRREDEIEPQRHVLQYVKEVEDWPELSAHLLP